MSDVKWIKITTNIFDDEKIRLIDGMADRDVIFYIWIRLLTMAGKTNEGGRVYLNKELAYTEEMLATIFNRPVEIVKKALEVFTKLKTLNDVGLSYIRLGQPAPTLSGGEAQRVKLGSELSKKSSGKTLYILDEPTTGLHFEDLKKLLKVLRRLVDFGNTGSAGAPSVISQYWDEIEDGDIITLAVVGSGLSWARALIEFGK